MFEKLIARNGSQKSAKSGITRDYWQIEILTPSSWNECVLVQGRRRTTEAYWPGLRLDFETLIRFGITIRNAITVAMGFLADEEDATRLVFPAIDTLAICHGACYIIETNETLDGFGSRSISTTIYTRADPILPAVHLIDDELKQFSKDIEAVVERLGANEQQSSQWQVPQVGVL